MKHLDDNPSRAEMTRNLLPSEVRKFKWLFWSGLSAMIFNVLLFASMALCIMPDNGPLTQAAWYSIIFGTPIYTVIFITGFKKGRDYRPTVGEMYSTVGGR